MNLPAVSSTTQPAKLPPEAPASELPGDEYDFERLRQDLEAYLPVEDIERVQNAYEFASSAHDDQKRKSGEPYISHPVAVARIVSRWRLDSQAVCAALLHDVVEDCGIELSVLKERFGKSTADLVDGLSKLDRVRFNSHEEAQAENFRKMLMAMASDLRVILIKLADRLHNMRTLSHMSPTSQKRIAVETLEIYAPIANRLGLNNLFRELQELAFQHRYPRRYQVLQKAVLAARGNRREVISKVLNAIDQRLADWKIDADINGREKHVYGIYRKMREKNLKFAEVLDIYGVRIIANDVANCYISIGALHGLYHPVPGKFKDYIAIPKANGYQSLHTSLRGPAGIPIEVQVRTRHMHHVAESGVASHWLYKEEGNSLTQLQQRTHSWLQSLVDLQSASGNAAEFLEHVKVDLFPTDVYAFSPAGQIFPLPRGSTAVDFAYAVHTDVGNHCVQAKINGVMMPLRTILKNGDQVEIIHADHARPNPVWINFVRTAKARAEIRRFQKNMHNEEATRLGETLLNNALRNHGLLLSQISHFAWERFLKVRGVGDRRRVFIDLGLGKRLPVIVARRLAEAQDMESGRPDIAKPRAAAPVPIRAADGMAVKLSKCCNPIPGDSVVAMFRKGIGIEVHCDDCPAVRGQRNNRHQWIDVEWAPRDGTEFETRIRVNAINGTGLLAQLSSSLAESEVNITDVNMDSANDNAHCSIQFTICVRDRTHLAHTLRRLRRIPIVIRVQRERSEDGRAN